MERQSSEYLEIIYTLHLGNYRASCAKELSFPPLILMRNQPTCQHRILSARPLEEAKLTTRLGLTIGMAQGGPPMSLVLR